MLLGRGIETKSNGGTLFTSLLASKAIVHNSIMLSEKGVQNSVELPCAPVPSLCELRENPFLVPILMDDNCSELILLATTP